MLLVISLIIVSLFIYFLKDSLKKHAGIYYIGAAVISIANIPNMLFFTNKGIGKNPIRNTAIEITAAPI